MQQTYRQLIDQFCALTGLDDPDDIAEGKSFNVDEVECAVIYQDQISPELVYCYIDFGLPPGNLLIEVYDQLLQANYLQFASTKSTFSLSPHTGHVILVSVVQLQEATAELLTDQFSYHAQQALEWRNHFFLTGSEGPAASNAETPFSNRSPLV
jgi:hypothetical protein